MSTLAFQQITLQGADAEKFLQGQLTADVSKLGLSYQPTAISNLKGRIEYGLWVKKHDENHFVIATSSDCMTALSAHLKKYGAFSKFTCSEPEDIYPCVLDGVPTFSTQPDLCDSSDWATLSIATGNYWIVAATQGLFQPQELRLHQRAGVDYDKGCYLGQEVIARIYFKSAPKAFLHRVRGTGTVPKAGTDIGKVHIVNAVAVRNTAADDDNDKADANEVYEALVVARPDAIESNGLTLLSLPEALQADVARVR